MQDKWNSIHRNVGQGQIDRHCSSIWYLLLMVNYPLFRYHFLCGRALRDFKRCYDIYNYGGKINGTTKDEMERG